MAARNENDSHSGNWLHFATIAFRNYRAASLRQSAKSKVNIFFARAPKCKVESQFKFYAFINKN
ncbi:MAG: hypothetical protein EBT51_11540 [Flavobacteriaceae bacterium]|nr:hypothetical protein [Flavobacteriaceae bacterium]